MAGLFDQSREKAKEANECVMMAIDDVVDSVEDV